MSASALIADTSVWIDLVHGLSVPTLEKALEWGMVVLPPIVAAELVSGARTSRDLALVNDLLIYLPLHRTPLEHWIRVGELRKVLRARGVTISTPDAHVAQCALDCGMPLLSRDRVFKNVSEILPLQLLTS